MCLAFAQIEWDMFGQVIPDVELNPHEILQALDEHLRLLPSVPGRELRVAPSTKLLFKNRIDEVVLFRPLAKDEVRAIAIQQIARIQRTLEKTGRSLVVTPEALEQLVKDGYSLAYGARFLKRLIEERIKLPISQQWNAGEEFTAEAREGHVAIDVSRATGLEVLAATA